MTAWPYILTIWGGIHCFAIIITIIAALVVVINDIVRKKIAPKKVLNLETLGYFSGLFGLLIASLVLFTIPGIIGFNTYNNTQKTTHTEQVYILPKIENGQSIIYKRDEKMVVYSGSGLELSEQVVNIYNFVEDEKVADGKVVLHTDITQKSEVNIYYNVWRKHYDKKYEYHINHKTLIELRGN